MDKTSQIFRDAAKVVADSKGLIPVDKERAAGLALQLAQLRDKIDINDDLHFLLKQVYLLFQNQSLNLFFL